MDEKQERHRIAAAQSKKGRSETTKRLAAATRMDLCLRWRDLKIEQRIADLEVEIYGQKR